MKTAETATPFVTQGVKIKSSMTISGISSDQALRALAYVEQQISDEISNHAAEPRRYHRFREWLIHGEVLRRILTSSLVSRHGIIPGLDMPRAFLPRIRRTLRVASSILDPRQSSVYAARVDAMVASSNLRGFYLSLKRPLTLKVAIRSAETSFSPPVVDFSRSEDARDQLEVPSSAVWLHREVVARQYAEQFFHIPPLLAYDFSGTYAYLVEPVIWGVRPGSRSTVEAVCDMLIPRLLKLYEHYGYRFQLPAETIGGHEALFEVEAALEFLGTGETTKRKLLAAAEELMHTSRQVAISFTHGDLAFINTLIDRYGTVYLLDWERAGENLIARDLGFLWSSTPKRMEQVAEAVLQSQAKSIPVTEICSLREQLGISAVRELASWQRQLQQCEWGRDIEVTRRRLRFQRGLLAQGLVNRALRV